MSYHWLHLLDLLIYACVSFVVLHQQFYISFIHRVIFFSCSIIVSYTHLRGSIFFRHDGLIPDSVMSSADKLCCTANALILHCIHYHSQRRAPLPVLLSGVSTTELWNFVSLVMLKKHLSMPFLRPWHSTLLPASRTAFASSLARNR